MSLSLRARVLAGLGLVAVVLVAVAAAVTTLTWRHLVAQVDERLEATVEVDRGRAGRNDTNHLPPIAGGQPDDTWVRASPQDEPTALAEYDDHEDGHHDSRGGADRLGQVFEGFLTDRGHLWVRDRADPSGDEHGIPDLDLGAVQEAAGRPFTTGSTDDETRYRVMATLFGGGWSLRAVPLEEVDETLRRTVAIQALGAAIVLAALAAVAWWVLRLGVVPINRMTASAEAIAADDLARRVPEPTAAGTETGRLARALNTMLERIQTAVERQAATERRLRQFVGDASHELRTPVTTIKGYAELYRQGGLPPGEPLDDAMRRTEQEANRMGRLVEDMLVLARLDQERPLDRAPVDLSAVLADAVNDGRLAAPDRDLTTAIEPGLVVDGDEDRLRQVVANLVGNALVHTPPDAPITVRGSRRDSQVLFEVIDQGPGMDEAVAARATERFFRADRSRSRARGGSGLGLAIVDAVVAAHGGQIGIDSTTGRGTTVSVWLPAQPGPEPAQG